MTLWEKNLEESTSVSMSHFFWFAKEFLLGHPGNMIIEMIYAVINYKHFSYHNRVNMVMNVWDLSNVASW
jgi:hypothetical protein